MGSLCSSGAISDVQQDDGEDDMPLCGPYPPLHRAILNNSLMGIYAVITGGNSPNSTWHGLAALDYSVMLNRDDCTRFLIEHGALFSGHDHRVTFSVAMVVENVSPPRIQQLITQCAPDAFDNIGNPMIHTALIHHAPIHVFDTLISHGSHGHIRNGRGMTALQLAYSESRVDVVRRLSRLYPPTIQDTIMRQRVTVAPIKLPELEHVQSKPNTKQTNRTERMEDDSLCIICMDAPRDTFIVHDDGTICFKTCGTCLTRIETPKQYNCPACTRPFQHAVPNARIFR